MTRGEKAKALFEEGYNCCQAVVLSFSDILGIDEKTLSMLASGFGGGMRCGGVCGVISACVVVLGMAYPSTLENGPDGKKRSTQLVKEFQRRFQQRFRQLNCHELLAEPEIEGTSIARELGVTHHCRLLVVSGVEMLCGMLEELEAQ